MFKRILTLSLLLLLTACASVTRGTREEFVIESQPEGAKAILSSGQTCITPCTLKLKRKHSFSVRIEKDGFMPADAAIDSHVAAAGVVGFAGNVLIGGIVGAGVDIVSGATKGLAPNPLTIALAPAPDIEPVLPDLAMPDRRRVTPGTELASLPGPGVTEPAAPQMDIPPGGEIGDTPGTDGDLEELARAVESDDVLLTIDAPGAANATAAAGEPIAPVPAVSAPIDTGTVPPVQLKRKTLDISRW